MADRVSLQTRDRAGLGLLRGFDGCRRREAFVDPDFEGPVAGKAADEDAQHEERHRQHPRGLFKKVRGALDTADLAGSLESSGESSPLGILDQNHCPQQEADNQNDDGKESGHVQFFKSYAAFSAGPQNKHFFPGISKPEACKLSLRDPFGLAGRRAWPWFL